MLRRSSSPGGLRKRASRCSIELARPPLAGHVHHLGYVEPSERERLYRQASMVVLPSLDEGFGLPALEAMTMGVPVVVSSRGALPEVVGRAGLIVEPDDIAGLTAAMDRLLSDPALARTCVAEGLEQSRRFSWDVSATRLIEAYGSAIERRRARR